MQNGLLRSFVAAEIPPEIQQAISNSTAGLQRSLPKPLVRWVAPQNIHLTLQFLGDVSPPNLDQLAETLKEKIVTHNPIDVLVGTLGTFPTPQRVRVFWIGLEAPAALTVLQRGVEEVTARLGYPSEERKFSPHLTIGRVNQNAGAADMQRITSILQQTDVGILGRFQIVAIHIYKSDLFPTGPVYTRLYSLPLASGS